MFDKNEGFNGIEEKFALRDEMVSVMSADEVIRAFTDFYGMQMISREFAERLQAERLIKTVLEDKGMEYAERCAVCGVMLFANNRGLALDESGDVVDVCGVCEMRARRDEE